MRLLDPDIDICEEYWPGILPGTRKKCWAHATHKLNGKWVCDCHDPATAPKINYQEDQIRGCMSEYDALARGAKGTEEK